MSIIDLIKQILGLLSRSRSKDKKLATFARNRKIQTILHHKRLHDIEREQASSVVSEVGNQKIKHTVVPVQKAPKEATSEYSWKKRVNRVRRRVLKSKERVRSLSSR